MLPTAHRLGTWLRRGAQIKFYPGRYAAEKCSILPVGDPTQYIPDSEVWRFAVTKGLLLVQGTRALCVCLCSCALQDGVTLPCALVV